MTTLHPVYLNHASAYLPNAPVDNDHMEAILGMVGELPSRVRQLILRSNAIRTRHYAIDPVSRQATHTTTDMAAKAIRQLFAQGVNPNAIDTLACATSYPDQILPGHGVMVHGLLPELPACEVISHAGVCVAGMAAMKHAWLAVRSGESAQAIACASECASAILRSECFRSEITAQQLAQAKADIGFSKDFLRWMLSDGAGAVHLSRSPNPDGHTLKILWIDILSYAHEMPVCMYAGGEREDGRFTSWKSVDAATREQKSYMAIKQDVKLLNEHIIHYTIEKPLIALQAKRQLRSQDIAHFLPHYSSGYFRDKVAAGLSRVGLPIAEHQWFTNLASKGNTGSASIYLMLEEFLRTRTLLRGEKILCYIPESGRFSTCFMLLEVQ